MGRRLNLDGGKPNLDWGAPTLDGGTRSPTFPLQFKYCVHPIRLGEKVKVHVYENVKAILPQKSKSIQQQSS